MRILVTGGAGFIGSHYVRSLLADEYVGVEGAYVTVLDRLTYAGNRANLPAEDTRLQFIQGDVCDSGLLAELLPGHDAVVHFAAESHVDRSITGAAEFVRTNVLGTQNLMEEALRSGVGRVVHVSTDEVYGSVATGAWDENEPLVPNSPYAASKASADLLARAYARTHGLDVVVTRCSNNYGPYQHPEKLIPRFTTDLLQGQKVTLYGDGGNVREWLHVADHCRAVHLALTKGVAGEVYNVGGGNELTNIEITERLLELCGADRSAIEWVADRPGHDRRYAIDESKIRAELGYEPLVSFTDGLAQTVTWYRDNPDWWRPLRQSDRSCD
ncbi:dTDP-glucose 4,6-dehydratase [Lipingzhangella sp. LS1_29]|uniref:dTDP-glucose 4,6-dehydratase n=1 Tax=Lipingzhangella rawalii TaxID=2055835 RepID=A0ABU2H7K2_9ACTN|nr:dTDP-glucose 4,6-dehydratase [Lipingzhangella rawalii]MDS1270785.1 dTDP-glucose 4,6-dehydratase [Lipingzhangella rawalii]